MLSIDSVWRNPGYIPQPLPFPHHICRAWTIILKVRSFSPGCHISVLCEPGEGLGRGNVGVEVSPLLIKESCWPGTSAGPERAVLCALGRWASSITSIYPYRSWLVQCVSVCMCVGLCVDMYLCVCVAVLVSVLHMSLCEYVCTWLYP